MGAKGVHRKKEAGCSARICLVPWECLCIERRDSSKWYGTELRKTLGIVYRGKK